MNVVDCNSVAVRKIKDTALLQSNDYYKDI